MYGESQYGTRDYGTRGADRQDGGEYFVDLAQYAPPFLAAVRELREIYRVEGYEIGQLQHDLWDCADQCFLETATWGLELWEQMWGVESNLSLTYEQRREILKAKMRGQGTTTIKMLQETAKAFSGGDVDVIEDNPHHRFIVRFIGIKGIPRNMQAFVSMLDEIKPAHLAYEFEYRFTTWNETKPYTWDNLGTITWDEVRILKEE